MAGFCCQPLLASNSTSVNFVCLIFAGAETDAWPPEFKFTFDPVSEVVLAADIAIEASDLTDNAPFANILNCADECITWLPADIETMSASVSKCVPLTEYALSFSPAKKLIFLSA